MKFLRIKSGLSSMRIRNRKRQAYLSSLSDLHTNDSSGVQQHNLLLTQPNDSAQVENHAIHDNNTADIPLHLSNQPIQSLSPIGNWVSSESTGFPLNKNKHYLDLLVQGGDQVEDEDKRRKDGEKSNDTWKGSILGAETCTGFELPLSNSSHQGMERWREGEKTFPIKKRMGSLERRGNEEEKEKKIMKTKMNKKGVDQQYDETETETIEEVFDNNKNGPKKRSRGGAILEGSRCSRVNGRGWRCCQQTLVGYSLCEHHLGKGRLRSMTSVRNRAMPAATSTSAPNKDDHVNVVEKKQGDHMLTEGESKVEDEKKPSITTKKRMKIGMVKARSLSSLLGQTNSTPLQQ